MPDELMYGHGHHYPHHGPHWSAEPTFGQTASAIHTGDTGLHILNAQRVAGVQDAIGHNNILGGQSDIRSDIRDSAHAANRDLASGQRDILGSICDGDKDVLKELCDVRGAIHADGGTTRDRIATEGRFMGQTLGDIRRENSKDHCDIEAAVSREGGESRLKTVETSNALLHAVERQHSDAMQVMTRGFCDTSKDILQTKSDLQLQASNIHMDTKQQMFDFKQSVEKQLAECCCDIKELVRDQNGQTREAIRETETQRLRDELARANSTLLTFQVNNGPGKS